MNDNQESKDFLFKIILILLGITIISGVVFGLLNRQENGKCSRIDGNNRTSAKKEFRSLGEEVLVNLENDNSKIEATKAFKSCNFEQAENQFTSWRQEEKNDPEALIYLNNVIVAQNSKEGTLKIVVSVPFGTNLGVAQEILRGVAQAQKEVNDSGGINGKLLLVEIANDNNDDALVTELAQEFIDDETIMAVVGHSPTKITEAVSPIDEKQKLVTIFPTGGARDVIKKDSDYAFRTVPPTEIYAQKLANRIYYDRNSGDFLNKIAICYDSDDTHSKSFRKEFKDGIWEQNNRNASLSFPRAEVFDTDCDLSVGDLNPQAVIQNIEKKGADSLLLIASINTIENALKIAKANKINNNLPLFGSTSIYTGKTVEIGRENVEGMVLAAPWHPSLASNNNFADDAYKLWGGPVNWRTALAYDATKVIIEGLKKSEGETREGLQKTLKEPGFSVKGATGTVQFDEWGDRLEKPPVLVQIEKKPNSKSGTGYDFELLPSQ